MQHVLENQALRSRLEQLQRENAQLREGVPRFVIRGTGWQLEFGGHAHQWTLLPQRCAWRLDEDRRNIAVFYDYMGVTNAFVHIRTQAVDGQICVSIHDDVWCNPTIASILLNDLEALGTAVPESRDAVDAFVAAARQFIKSI